MHRCTLVAKQYRAELTQWENVKYTREERVHRRVVRFWIDGVAGAMAALRNALQEKKQRQRCFQSWMYSKNRHFLIIFIVGDSTQVNSRSIEKKGDAWLLCDPGGGHGLYASSGRYVFFFCESLRMKTHTRYMGTWICRPIFLSSLGQPRRALRF